VPGHKGGGGGGGGILALNFSQIGAKFLHPGRVGRVRLHKVGWVLGNKQAVFHYKPGARVNAQCLL